MCGIIGIYNYATSEPVDRTLLKRMTDILSHRGPDGEGQYYDDKNGIGFGHRRLAIIDLKTGQQPMSDENQSIWITYNGEIYNYREIKKDLITKGYQFRTDSDTEVLIYAYREYGTGMLDRLNGIFAFAIWDALRKELFIARDHLGVKPLYYYDTGKCLVFGSEIKALLLVPSYRKDVDREAIDLHLTFRHTPSPRTLFQNIYKLPPGSYMKVSSGGKPVSTGYWCAAQEIDHSKKLNEWLPDLEKGIEAAVERQMVSDVPISLSLSSGIDSNLLLAIMSRHTKNRVNCFTIGFKDNPVFDEMDLARESADHFQALYTGRVISSNDYEEMFDKYMTFLEEPLGNESALAYYFVAKLAKENNIKVLLNGQGADELFGGYHRYIGERYRAFLRIAPPFLTRPLSRKIKNERLRRSLYTLNEPDELERFFLIYSVFLPEEKEKMYGTEFKRVIDADAGKQCLKQYFPRFTNQSSLDKMLHIDLRFSLPDDLLLAEDKMAMATGVEARVPFLDVEFLHLVERIPAEYKIKNFHFKYIHKKYVKKWLPQDFIRRKKIGFTNPMRTWLTSELEQYFQQLVKRKGSFTDRFLNPDFVNELFYQHKAGLKDYKRNLFLILSMEQWYDTFFRGR